MNSKIVVMIFLSLCFVPNFAESSSFRENIMNPTNSSISEIEEIEEQSSYVDNIKNPNYSSISEIEEIEEQSSYVDNIKNPNYSESRNTSGFKKTLTFPNY
ncbi:uncharacterized protein LOC126906724 isoform X2 [Daktulosphaira vitifoliae]|uniref:uncharacterized protein LOC126906724 isoform X2 n=1 Tax=Daktulosphaira vitifoliae TaxID=58002 RepID=UPI0021A9ED3D|nr:uncharacterized protein LOC126906724 isoform X2 [Daktulosphaira vitifoliae]